MTVLGYAYPWDVLGDPGFVERVRALGLDGVNLAAAYHTTRAATPWHPARVLVNAAHSAFYRPVRPEAWRLLRPAPPEWLDADDSFGAAAIALTEAGIPVHAWIVLTHNSLLGTAHPELAVRNCFGDTYPYALCSSHPEVRDYAATLVAETVRDLPLAGVCLEACGQLGIDHADHHEKTAGAYTPTQRRLLSLCCCLTCLPNHNPATMRDPSHQSAWTTPSPSAGLRGGVRDGPHRSAAARSALGDRDAVLAELRAAVRASPSGAVSGERDQSSERVWELAGELLKARQAATDELRAGVVAAAGGRRVTLHSDPDPWATGPLPGLTPRAAEDADAVVVQCWQPGEEAGRRVARVRELVGPGIGVGGYVTVLPPAVASPGDDVTGHVRALAAAGADELHLYHLGLAGPDRSALLGDAVRTFREFQ